MNKKFLVSYLIFFLLFYGCSEKSISEKQKAINAYKEKQSNPPIANSQSEEVAIVDEGKIYISLTEEEIPLTFYKKGVEYASQGKFEKAKEQFNKALNIYKFDEASIKILNILEGIDKGAIDKDYVICFLKGENYNLNGNIQQAILELQRAIQIDSVLTYAYEGLGVIYFSLGEYQQAIAEFQKVIQIDSNNASCYGILGLAYNALRQPQKAITELQKAIQINPNYARAYVGLGHVYFSMGQHQKAIAEFEKAIEINPGISDGYDGLGVIYNFLGQYEKSMIYNKKAIQVNPGDGAAYAGIGINYFYLGQFQQAIPYLQRSIQINLVFPEPYYGLGLANFSLGQYNEAKEAFQKAKELFESRGNFNMAKAAEIYLNKIKELIED